MRLAEEMGNDFLHAHHRVASLYFAITAVEAQLNQTIRLLREKRSEDDEEIEWDIRHLNLEAKFRQLAKLANDSAVPLEAESVPTILNANRVRNELTHRKTWGYETYPYWLTGWNFVTRGNANGLFMKFDFFQVKVSLQQLGFPGLPMSDSLGHQFRSTFLRDLAGYKRLASFLDNVGRCRPFDPRFPFTPVFCRKWWDVEHINRRLSRLTFTERSARSTLPDSDELVIGYSPRELR
jgi:hypothetical protein